MSKRASINSEDLRNDLSTGDGSSNAAIFSSIALLGSDFDVQLHSSNGIIIIRTDIFPKETLILYTIFNFPFTHTVFSAPSRFSFTHVARRVRKSFLK